MRLRNIAATAMIAASLAASAQAPKYIFYMIGDGMGMGHITNAQVYNRAVLHNDTPLTMMQFPVASFATTHSASSDVTDSAAAGTALATGHKTRNSMLGMNPDTVAVTSIAKTLFDNGYGVGLITTVAIDDATPGAFYAHVPNRGEYTTIGHQLAQSGYQFAAGAGLRGTTDKKGNDTGLLDDFARNGVKISYGMNTLDTIAPRVLLLSTDTERPWNVGYTIDSIPGALNLPEMTSAGIRHMQRTSPERFFMMIEGGNIDHAGHANDGGAVIIETLNFDKAIALVRDFYLAHPDETLIVVTADHETGGMSVGNDHTGYSAPLGALTGQKVSKEVFSDYCKGILRSRMVYKWPDMREYLADNLGFWNTVPVTDEQEKEIEEMFDRTFEQRNAAPDEETLYANFNAFSSLIFKILNDNAGVGWTSTKHTGTVVPVFAIGAGAEKFASMRDNTAIPRTIMEIAGIPME